MLATVRAALTQTVNAYAAMPATLAELSSLRDRLEEVRQANLDHHVDLLGRAAAAGARIACLGELFAAPYFALHHHKMWHAMAEDAATGPTASCVMAAARELSMVIVAPLYERAPDGRRFNAAIVVEADGRVLGKYRKTHIPAGRNERGAFFETAYFGPSDGVLGNPPEHLVSRNPFFPVFQTSVGRVGVAICYDRHFGGVMASLAAGGAQLVFSPAVTFGAQSERMWPLEFAVDAARHRLVVGGSNRRGVEPPWNQPFFGASHFVAPEGPLADLSEDPELVIADLPLEALAAADGSGWDLARDRRPGIYSWEP